MKLYEIYQICESSGVRSKHDLESLLDQLEDDDCDEGKLKTALTQHGFEWKEVKFNTESVIVVNVGEVFVIEEYDYPRMYMSDAKRWIHSITSSNLHYYVDADDFNEMFWKQVSPGYVVFHATNPSNEESIIHNGIEPRKETRAISNRGMGNAVYTHTDPDHISSYGSLVLEIDVYHMKEDGYTPDVSMEEPYEEEKMREKIANMIGVEYQYDYSSEGLHEDTIVFYGEIPAKYLKVY